MKGKLFLLIFIMVILLLKGCTLIPKYEKPAAPVPVEWPKGAAYQEAIGPTPPEIKWPDFITDEKLKKIIEQALRNNRDLRLAALQVQKVRALYGIQRAELYPTVSAAGTGSVQRVPADLSPKGKEMTAEQYSINLGISSWEIDFFGRIQSLKESALEEYLASEQGRRSAQISLIAAIASVYLTLAADQENLELAQSTLQTQEAAYNLIRRRYEVGVASELELRQAQTQVDTAKREIAHYTQLIAQDKNALQLLLGGPVPQELLPEGLGRISPFREISPGLSSEVLLQRPDIQAAEHRLKAAQAYIGAARAAFFPRIALTAGVGTASAELSGLFKSGSGTWNFMPQIVMPIFDARTWSAYEASKVEREIALTQYEKAIQTAFREVADALAVHGTVADQLKAQESLVKALAETHRLAEVRYLHGLDSYLAVLDAQRALFAARQGLVSMRLAKIANQVKLYAVLGGGGE
ncbi:MAG: efflux transporter outer membrane subunit [Thermodesulfobacteriota bacterium]